MSCEKCQEAQEKDQFTYYRWKNANVEMRGCPEHLREIFEVLNTYQSAPEG